MDWLDRLNEQNEEFAEGTLAVIQIPEKKNSHLVTVIGCVKGVDGWYRAGYDENTKSIIPLEKLG